MSSSKELTEELITELNGCGRYQIFSTVIMMLAEGIVCWSMIAMTFNGKPPDYTCIDNSLGSNSTEELAYRYANSTYSPLKACNTINDTDCSSFLYEGDIHTIVDEWNLVCDRKWIVAMITTLQMAGVFVGCFVAGQIGDSLGRRPTFYLSLFVLVVFNIAAFFSTNWAMYAAMRFMLGSGIGAFLIIRYIILTEFMSSEWRPRIMAIPGWASNCAMYALFVWAIKDWKYLHLATAAAGAPFLFTYCFVQESGRWQMTKHRFKDAERTIGRIATVNGKPKPDLTKLFARVKDETKTESTTNYTVFDLFKTASRIKMSLGLLFIWFSISYTYYGLTFGVGTLAGNFYLNLFLTNIIETPTSVLVVISLKRLGRKYSCVVFFILLGICGTISGAFQYIDSPYSGTVITVFALISKMVLSVTWGCLNVYTTELYPTVVRTIGVGLCNGAARVGGMIAPQTVFLGDEIPGLLYFPNAALSFISGLLCLILTETRDRGLEDTLETKQTTHNKKNSEKQSVYSVE